MKLSMVLLGMTILGTACAPPANDASREQTLSTSAADVAPAPGGAVSAPTTTPSATNGQRLVISVESADASDPAKMDAAILRPESCVVNGGVVTATGAFAGPAPESYRRVAAFMVLHVYGPPGPGQAHGVELADVKHEGGSVWNGSLSIYGDGPWTVTAPVKLKAGAPTSCEVGIERAQPFVFHGAPG